MKCWLISACVFALIVVGGSCPAARAADTESELKNAVQTNVDGINEKSLEKAMSAIHGKSPDFLPTKDATAKLFKDYKLKQRIVSFHFFGADDDCAVARVKVETTQDKGPAFRNNVIDMIQVFRMESGKWKVWTSANLDVRYLDESTPKKMVK